MSYGRTLRPAAIGVHSCDPIRHPSGITWTHRVRVWVFWPGSLLLERLSKPWHRYGTVPAGKKPPFTPLLSNKTFRASVGPIFRALRPPRGPPTATVSYHGPSHNMGPNLYVRTRCAPLCLQSAYLVCKARRDTRTNSAFFLFLPYLRAATKLKQCCTRTTRIVAPIR